MKTPPKNNEPGNAQPNLFSVPKGIVVKRKNSRRATVLKKFPGAHIIDVTSRAQDEFVRFSPFYPHGNIPVPMWPGLTGVSVEAIWQGLKVFEGYLENPAKGPDLEILKSANMKGIKRRSRTLGQVVGHLCENKTLLTYLEARKKIYLPAYRYVLENYLPQELEKLRSMAENKTVVLLDFHINANINDVSTPLSHAALIKLYLEGRWPEEN